MDVSSWDLNYFQKTFNCAHACVSLIAIGSLIMLQCSRFFDRVLLLLVFFLVICSGNFRNAVTGGVGIARGVGIGEIFYVGIAKCREKRCRESRVYCI